MIDFKEQYIRNRKVSILLVVLLLAHFSCTGTTDSKSNREIELYFYLTDSIGTEKTIFDPEENIFFHFGIINTGNRVEDFTKGDSGPAVSFIIQTNDSLIGTSNDGYDYTQALVYGKLAPGDTISHSVSWYSNSQHDSLGVGNYCLNLKSNVYMLNLRTSTYPDSIIFQIQ